jgi:hypothetical protein
MTLVFGKRRKEDNFVKKLYWKYYAILGQQIFRAATFNFIASSVCEEF